MADTLTGFWAARIFAPVSALLLLAACGGDAGSSGAPPVVSYGLSGTLSHLDTGSLSLSDGAETVSVAQGATSFAFTKPIANGTAYSVTIAVQPSGANCVVNNATGTINGAAVGNVAVVCNTLVSQPLTLGVIASGSLSSNGSRIFLPVSQVGTNATTINAIFDTGSAGTSLRATDIFPASMVSSTGFVFNGQTSLTYNGITVTNVVATRTYGAQSNLVTEQTGNLGFAQVTFGTGVQATTGMMPILFVYQTKSNGTAVATSNFANLIGVNPSLAAITVGGVAATSTPTPCTLQFKTTCGLASPFRYLSYADGIDKGFSISNLTFSACDFTTPGACPVSYNLTLGLTTSAVAGFSTTALSGCGPIVLVGSTSEPVCSQVIPSVTISSGKASFTGPAIFDSGAPATRLSVPPGMTFPNSLPAGSIVRIATATGFAYQYATGTGYLTTTVTQGTSAADDTNSGIGFFVLNSFVLDYSRAAEGWRNG